MDRLERLLDLVHVLQTAPRPVPLSALKDQFADYAEGSDEAVRRKFERDKAELARIGVVLRYVEDEEGDAGYFVDAEATYLPDLPLDEADRAVLATAAQAALADPSFPHRRALRLALAKLGATPDDAVPEVHLAHGAADDLPEGGASRLEALGAALTARKRVRLRYRKARADDATERDVDPYGLFLRRGAWYLVGRDHRSGETRMFRVSRIEEATPNTKKPGTPDFEVPADFDLDAVMRTSPLRYAVHAPVEARVRVDPDVAFLLERQWGPPDADGVFTVETTHLDFLVDQVLGLGRRAELLAPPEGRARVAAALRAVLEAHGAEEAAS
ncbi:MAG TPA: WYL domain-containing protein [Polyangiaceae bacterium LLY-WYZ-15_(1-7)]|nr:DNA-binding transcriptional regulator [Sandaracinus sp.]HJL05363.1 WYL domain-containing protein [Polyangiaceae bacterium LLY-WYZ-15_(1-7)]MBJ73223.1 DNA-binding transcriptional regulator [Sandaracinus sp.]HJL11237.1 WYL domain-containing protein [Polyangiaceae bacterium LLY-WYZ-15_(1-7)]HJL24638.1 WYL domain-containing protein [Polyangiaceae bacterium LLY-WYZ-15_(1-7)]